MLERLIDLGSVPLLVLALWVAGLGVPIPEDIVLVAGGVVAHRSSTPTWLVFGLLYASVIGADCLVFFVTRRYGERLLGRAPLRWLITPRRRARVRRLFDRYGARAVFVGRHLGGIRTVVFAFASLEGVPFRVFVLWDALAGLISVPLAFGLGYLFSSHASAVAEGVARAEHWAVLGLALAAALAWLVWRRSRGRGPDSPPDSR